MAQTPQQRRANDRFAKHEAAKRGKGPVTTKPKQTTKTPISASWLVILAFVVCGGLILELLKVVPEVWSIVASTISRVTALTLVPLPQKTAQQVIPVVRIAYEGTR